MINRFSSMGSYRLLLFFGFIIEGVLFTYRMVPTEPAQTVIKYILAFSLFFLLVSATHFLFKRAPGFDRKIRTFPNGAPRGPATRGWVKASPWPSESPPEGVAPRVAGPPEARLPFGHKEYITILAFAFIFQLTLLPVAPEMSDDIYRYIWDGKLQAHGINPYTYAPDDPALNSLHSRELPRLVNFPHIKTIYPPTAQLLFRLSYHLFGESVTGLKALFMIFQLGACFLFYLLLSIRQQHPALLLFFAWNPLVIMETAVNGHLDIVM
ncbi:MAG: hypothetical protein GY765_34140, partial [bacterium]|nr:hypothetical protein [bacterium]